MTDGFIRVAAATPEIRVADCRYNRERVAEYIQEARKNDVKVLVFPELVLTGYTCGDLFLHRLLLKQAWEALRYVAARTRGIDMLVAVGVPVERNQKIYNCAAVICDGQILGIVPKQNIPSYSEFYEARYFTPGKTCEPGEIENIPFGSGMIFRCPNYPDLAVGVEICEDVWVTTPPSCSLAKGGATLIVNLSASDEIIGKADYRRSLVKMQSAKTIAGYIYADAGQGESSTDMVYAGHNLIAENGALLAESKLFTTGLLCADLDIYRIAHERRRTTTFQQDTSGYIVKDFALKGQTCRLKREFPRKPFVPQNPEELSRRCEEILAMQANGLATRLRHTRAKSAVIGLSGGLDSALALVVAAHAFDLAGLPRKGILAVTMPCFGTTSRTKQNAVTLSRAYGTRLLEIPIQAAVTQHFRDIGQDAEKLDVTYENSQARERTQVLMDLANKEGGLVIGTGDLSELALGWATYNGDHMSMYAVNCSVPKTLVRYLIAHEARTYSELQEVLQDVLDTPVSPELLPPKDGEISQKTEELVGPYELHDFFLYYMLRYGYSPKKIYRIACNTFPDYGGEVIKKWLTVFVRRFFSQQFKRSCLPDGPKVGSVTLSPRGDWRMPSDASAALWLREIEAIGAPEETEASEETD